MEFLNRQVGMDVVSLIGTRNFLISVLKFVFCLVVYSIKLVEAGFLSQLMCI